MITTNTGAKKLESSDNWREIFPDNQGAQGAHNASVGAHDTAICQTCQTINGTTNNSGHTINSGEYFIANGGKYKATASIPNGEPWASSAEPVTDNDLINALNSNLDAISSKVQNFYSLPEGAYYHDMSAAEICNDLNSRFGHVYTVVFFTTTTTDGKAGGYYLATRNTKISNGVRAIQISDTWT